ncbi:homoserine O-acetyltransferase MetX [Desulfonatronum lacustre]|uniref:homoserine O-acetyltransferase MetX n=1 Tax=Desulfonatronum lacustre TaxID=66849 RepID=UPI0004B859D1|nr:homoserine O-acetyltransferase [Desulfonatronum lacustre]
MTQIVKRPETLPEIRPPKIRRLEPVRTQTVIFEGPGETLHLESGQTLHPVTVAYETYGRLNEGRDNAVLVCHALSGDAHAAGYYGLEKDEKPGWWDVLIGPGKPLDTDKYFVISSNFLGGCKGSTGPSSINPATGKPYGLDFPFYTVKDMVQVQRRLLKHLGVPRLLAVIGGSLGGMQVLQWAISFPEMVRGAIPIATTARLSPQAIAFNEVARQAIMSDPDWNGGDYTLDAQPERGLGLARMIGHITYLSEQAMLHKFSRRFINGQGRSFCLTKDFQVESYLHHQGSSFVRRFDANTYLYITRAMDYFDLEAAYGRLSTAFSGCRCPFLVVSFTSDWLFPPEQSRELVQALRRVGLDVSYCNIESDQGHDAFLLPGHRMGDVVAGFLDRLTRMTAS